VGAEFVWRMEDVLDLYAAPADPQRPRVCVDERPYQVVGETRTPLPAAPGQPARYDYEYRRNGTANLFVHFSPDTGWRHVDVTARRTKHDFALQLQALVDEHFPTAEVIRVVLDNLNTHTPAALYEAFPPEEARRLAAKLEFHYTPKHGSWLNMAELEISVLSRQCLERRLADIPTLRREVAAWEAPRNAAGATVHWRFTSTDARTKLHRLYPS
jgi:DDE superfamily endonuclease